MDDRYEECDAGIAGGCGACAKCDPAGHWYGNLTARITKWVRDRLGERLLRDKWERSMRVLEEAMEVGQACGISRFQVFGLMVRVYGRPVGDLKQELAGLNVCLRALAASQMVGVEEVTLEEVDRIEKMDPVLLVRKQNEKAGLGLGLRADACPGCGASPLRTTEGACQSCGNGHK